MKTHSEIVIKSQIHERERERERKGRTYKEEAKHVKSSNDLYKHHFQHKQHEQQAGWASP